MKMRNPFLPKLGVEDILLIGAVVFFGPKVLEMIKTAFPERPAGGTAGDPSKPGATYPSTPTFRDVTLRQFSISKSCGWAGCAPGDSITAHWHFQHIGPPGTYVAGVRLKQAAVFGGPISVEIEKTFTVIGEGSYGQYDIDQSYVLPTWLPLIFSYDIWVRDTAGIHLLDHVY